MPIANDNPASEPTSPACPCGGSALELVGKTPRVGPYPELKTFRCSACGEVSTVESD
jgi:hypothetical protein